MDCVPAACPLPDGTTLAAAAVPCSTFPLVGLLPWAPPQPWHRDSKAWQEMFNPAKTPGNISMAQDMAVSSEGEEVHVEGSIGIQRRQPQSHGGRYNPERPALSRLSAAS